MGNLLPISKRYKGRKGVSITIGVDGRMYLSKEFRDMLNHNKQDYYYLYYDRKDCRIGISKICKERGIEPFRFNLRGEGNVTTFVEDCEINIPGKPVDWLYEGKEGEIYIFYKKGLTNHTYKQDKYGLIHY